MSFFDQLWYELVYFVQLFGLSLAYNVYFTYNHYNHERTSISILYTSDMVTRAWSFNYDIVILVAMGGRERWKERWWDHQAPSPRSIIPRERERIIEKERTRKVLVYLWTRLWCWGRRLQLLPLRVEIFLKTCLPKPGRGKREYIIYNNLSALILSEGYYPINHM